MKLRIERHGTGCPSTPDIQTVIAYDEASKIIAVFDCSDKEADSVVKAVNCRDELIEACQDLIVALRAQAQLAVRAGGDVALHNGNAAAWDKACAAIKKAREQ